MTKLSSGKAKACKGCRSGDHTHFIPVSSVENEHSECKKYHSDCRMVGCSSVEEVNKCKCEKLPKGGIDAHGCLIHTVTFPIGVRYVECCLVDCKNTAKHCFHHKEVTVEEVEECKCFCHKKQPCLPKGSTCSHCVPPVNLVSNKHEHDLQTHLNQIDGMCYLKVVCKKCPFKMSLEYSEEQK